MVLSWRQQHGVRQLPQPRTVLHKQRDAGEVFVIQVARLWHPLTDGKNRSRNRQGYADEQWRYSWAQLAMMRPLNRGMRSTSLTAAMRVGDEYLNNGCRVAIT